jgi:hypothetical protein
MSIESEHEVIKRFWRGRWSRRLIWFTPGVALVSSVISTADARLSISCPALASRIEGCIRQMKRCATEDCGKDQELQKELTNILGHYLTTSVVCDGENWNTESTQAECDPEGPGPGCDVTIHVRGDAQSYSDGVPVDFCAALAHELSHASRRIDQRRISGRNSARQSNDQVEAIKRENAYRRCVGLQLRSVDTVPDLYAHLDGDGNSNSPYTHPIFIDPTQYRDCCGFPNGLSCPEIYGYQLGCCNHICRTFGFDNNNCYTCGGTCTDGRTCCGGTCSSGECPCRQFPNGCTDY